MRIQTGWAALVALVLTLVASSATAFCGFFVSGGGQVSNDASQVALMRVGTTTVLSMRNSYGGPPEDFALVVPVPVVLQEGQVRTLSPQAFDRLDQLTAPRLVEYWEQDPCPEPVYERSADNKEGGTGTRAKGEEGSMGNPQRPPVRIEASYSVDEYDIVILSADDSTALEVWLKDNGYKMPAGIEPYLRPYVLEGSKFFVAKVDVKRVRFLWGRAVLSPLRFHYDSERFALPIRLGLANATAAQDLVVYILSPNARYEVANYDNVFAPTNLEVDDAVRDQFGSFYASLFDLTVAGKPRAVVTEYSWDAGSCDPCPVPPLDDGAITELGGDVLAGERASSFVLTRLHARYTKQTAGEDLVFRAATPVEGGREVVNMGNPNATPVSHTAEPSNTNNFQARYIIRHPWKGDASCAEPRFGVWGGPPANAPPPPPTRPMVGVRRDLPLDTLIVAAPVTGAGKTPGGTARAASRADQSAQRKSWLAETWSELSYKLRKKQSVLLSIGLLPFGALILIGVSRRRLKRAFAHAALFVTVGGLPLLLLSSHRSDDILFNPRWGKVVLLTHVVVALLMVLLLLRARAGLLGRDWWLPLLAMIPLAAGVAAYRGEIAWMMELLPTLPPDDAARVLADGEGDALHALALGAGLSALLLPAAAVALWRPVAERSSSGGVVVALGALIGAAGVAVAYAPWEKLHRGGVPKMLAPLLLAAAVWLAWRLRVVPASQEERRAHAANLAVSTFLLAVAGALAGVALVAFTFGRGLDELGISSIVPDEVGRVVAAKVEEAQRLRGRSLLAVLSLSVPLLALLVWRWRAADLRLGVRPALRMAAPLAAVIALWMTYSSARDVLLAQHRPVALAEDRLGAVADLEIVPLAGGIDVERMGAIFAGPALLVSAGGELFGSATSQQQPTRWTDAHYQQLGEGVSEPRALPEPLLMAHRELTLGQLQQGLAPFFARQQTWFRWVFGASKLSQHGGGLGAYADLVADFVPRRTLAVDWLPELRVRTEDAEIAKRATSVAVRRAGDGVDVRPLIGGHGSYQLRANEPTEHHAFANRAQTFVSADVLRSVEEVVVIVAQDVKVADVGALMLAMLPDDDDDWSGRRARMRPAPRFVLTSDDAPFR